MLARGKVRLQQGLSGLNLFNPHDDAHFLAPSNARAAVYLSSIRQKMLSILSKDAVDSVIRFELQSFRLLVLMELDTKLGKIATYNRRFHFCYRLQYPIS
jgi:hypothetical protein